MVAEKCASGGGAEPAGSSSDFLALHRRAAASLRRRTAKSRAKERIVRAIRALAKGSGALASPIWMPLLHMVKRAARRVHSTARRWRGVIVALALAPTVSSSLQQAAAEPAGKRGGTLEFAVLVEPGNYDCHANISFAFLHPIAPHYSTLLKFDAPTICG